MWKRAVEKPVEIVEKCEFSTAIRSFSNYAPAEIRCIDKCIREERRGKHKIMLPGRFSRYLQKKGEKVGKTEKVPRQKGPIPDSREKYL